MAGAGPQTSKLSIPKPSVSLLEGVSLKRWDEESAPYDCVVKTDELGLVLGFVAEGKDSSYLDLSFVSDVRIGPFAKAPKDARTREALLPGDDSLDDRLVSVAYGSNMFDISFINFGASSAQVAKEFAADVMSLMRNVFLSNDNVMLFVRKAHAKLMFSADSSGRIPVKLVMNTMSPTKDEKKQFESALQRVNLPTGKDDFIQPDWFSYEVFYHVYCNYVKRHDVEVVFSQLSGGKKPYIALPQLRDFLNKTQRDPRLNEILYPYYTDDQVRALIRRYESNVTMADKGHMTVLGFQKFLQSDENRLIDAMALDLTHDMTQPLCHYFINSSHNTYLTGHQLTGKSSVEIYRQALLSGCRCVELDCWDGTGGEQEPVITHGYTMVTEIPFKDVVLAINETAFATSDYPVILSFENHCSTKQQQKMAQYCRDIFKEKLLSAPFDDIPLQEGVPLPSPERLKGKILIKNKKKAATKDVPDEVKTDDGTREMKRTDTDLTIASESSLMPNGGEDQAAVDDMKMKREQAYAWEGQIETNLELVALVNYITPVRFKGFDDAHAKNRSYEMSSMNETNTASKLKQNPVELVNYNKRQIIRVYPKGSRYDSSNYMPQVFWNAGCQMVSLNFQTCDIPFQLHLGKYEFNRRCGYLLKPVCMRRPDKDFDPFVESPMDGVVAATVKVKVISGQLLCDHRCGTYVELDMFGLPTDTVRRKFKTKTVPNNSTNPIWDEEMWVFKKVVVPELAMLRFAVYEDGGKFLAQRVLPLTCIQAGYRHISLRNEFNQPLDFPTIFVLFQMSDYIPHGMADFLDALSNPIAHLAAVEKRQKQLEELYDDDEGLEEGRQNTPPASSVAANATGGSQGEDTKVKASVSSAGSTSFLDVGRAEGGSVVDAYTLTRSDKSKDKEKKDETPQATPVESTTSTEGPPTVDELKEDKEFKKLGKKLSKELSGLQKKHEKSLSALKRGHDKDLSKWKSAQTSAKSKKNTSALDQLEDQLKELTDRHGAELDDLEKRQAEEMCELKKEHIKQEYKLVGKLMVSAHTVQLKQLDSKHQKDADIEQKKSSKDVLDEVRGYREEHKDKTADKDELERKVREHRNKLAKQTAEKRNQLESQRLAERQQLVEDHETRLQQLQENETTAISLLEQDVT